MTTDVPINLAIPLDLHPGALRSGDQGLRDAASEAYRRWGEIVAAGEELTRKARGERPLPKRKLTAEDRARLEDWRRQTSVYQAELARKAQPLVERTLTRLERALERARAGRERLDAEIASAVVPRAMTSPYDVEIRAALKAGGDVYGALTGAIHAGQRDVVAAALGAPAMLTGLTDEQRDTLLASARERFRPEESAELAALDADVERAQRLHDRFLGTMRETISAWRSEEQAIIDRLGAENA